MSGVSGSRRSFLQLSVVGTATALVAACTPPAPPSAKEAAKPAADTAAAPTAAPAAKPTEAAAKAAAQAPAVGNQATITWKWQSAFGQTDVFHQMGVDLIKKIDEASGGRIKIDLLPNGAVVPFNQIIDATSQGLLDGGIGVPAYWFDKSRATSLFGTGPSFGMDAEQLIGWYHYGGGQELYGELIQQILKLDVLSFFGPPMPTQPLGWFKQEMRTADDFKGLKYRTVGLSADLFKEMGAAVVILPGPEVVPSLERGVIDGAEFNNPSSDKLLGFQDIVKVLMVQSYHQPVEILEFLVNKTKFQALPSDLQAVVRYSAMAESADATWKYFLDANSKDLQEIKSKGVRVITTPPSILDAQLKAWDVVVDRESRDPFFAKVLESQKQWAARVVPLRAQVMVDNSLAVKHYFPNAT
jgi:TRAP-type mannitol/chloroaromatic compound transport system substrate-binding protein